MAVDPQKLEDTRAWLIRATRDLATAEQLLNHPHPLLDSVVYHCHQAAEKALKGYLFWQNIPFRRTHDLGELLAQGMAVDSTLADLEEIALALTPFATQFRYPGDILEPPFDEAEDAFQNTRFVVSELMQRLPTEVRPA